MSTSGDSVTPAITRVLTENSVFISQLSLHANQKQSIFRPTQLMSHLQFSFTTEGQRCFQYMELRKIFEKN